MAILFTIRNCVHRHLHVSKLFQEHRLVPGSKRAPTGHDMLDQQWLTPGDAVKSEQVVGKLLPMAAGETQKQLQPQDSDSILSTTKPSIHFCNRASPAAAPPLLSPLPPLPPPLLYHTVRTNSDSSSEFHIFQC